MQRKIAYYSSSEESDFHDGDDSYYSDEYGSEEEIGYSDEEEEVSPFDWYSYSSEWKLSTRNTLTPPKAKVSRKLSNLKEPIEYFQLFMDNKVLEQVCALTERYYQDNNSTNQNSSHKKKKKWEAPDVPTLKCFFGILLSMGIIKRGSYRDYWSSSKLFGTPGISEIMSCHHFEQIKNNLHFVDESSCGKQHVLYKIRPLIEHFIVISQDLYTPRKDSNHR